MWIVGKARVKGGIYLINGISSRFMVVLGDFQAIQDASISSKGRNFDRVSRGKEGRPPIVDEPFVYNNETFDIVEFLASWLCMLGNEIFLVPGKS